MYGTSRTFPYMAKPRRLEIRLEDELFTELKKLAEQYGMTVSQAARFAIQELVHRGEL